MDASAGTDRNKSIILLMLVVVIIAAFLLLDFRLVRGKANASSQVSTYATGLEKGGQLTVNKAMEVYVTGNTEIGASLAEALSFALGGIPGIGPVEIGDGEPAHTQDSVLVIEVQDYETQWTPVYSRSDVLMQVAYASDGEVDWIDEQTVEFTNNGPVVRVRGDYQMNASASGLMSLPGYRSYLAETLAQQIGSSLSERLFNPNP